MIRRTIYLPKTECLGLQMFRDCPSINTHGDGCLVQSRMRLTQQIVAWILQIGYSPPVRLSWLSLTFPMNWDCNL